MRLLGYLLGPVLIKIRSGNTIKLSLVDMSLIIAALCLPEFV
jgi:uncharacterized protein YggT (Ycf19 family)